MERLSMQNLEQPVTCTCCLHFLYALKRNICFPSFNSSYSEDLCIFDEGSSQYFTSSACKFLAEKCLNSNQFHFVHAGSCQEGPQLEWGLERLKLAMKSTKRVPCGYDTCYDWEKCSAHTSNCVCLLPPQCPKDENQLHCVKMGSSMRGKTVNICTLGAVRCANRKVEILNPGRCLDQHCQ